MTLVMTSGPLAEPVSVADAKAHMRIDSTAEDALIASLIVTSRLHIEAALGLALLSQTWSYFVDAWPRSREIVLPLKPVQAVATVRVWAQDGTSQTVSADTYTLDGEGTPQCIDSVAVNAYLRGITGRPFTAKNFRTWAGTVLAAKAVCDLPECTSDAAFKRNIVRAVDAVAAKMGNTRAVCRGSYIHPAVFDGYRRGVTIATAKQGPRRAGMSVEEAAVLALLKRGARHPRHEKVAA